jgi:hypothetical protein
VGVQSCRPPPSRAHFFIMSKEGSWAPLEPLHLCEDGVREAKACRNTKIFFAFFPSYSLMCIQWEQSFSIVGVPWRVVMTEQPTCYSRGFAKAYFVSPHKIWEFLKTKMLFWLTYFSPLF